LPAASHEIKPHSAIADAAFSLAMARHIHSVNLKAPAIVAKSDMYGEI
jgi:hypothetical protein